MFQKPIRRIREPGKSRRNGEKKRTQKIYLPDMASKFLAFSLVPLFPLIPNRSETRTRGASELKNFSATPNHQPDRDWEERWNGGCGCSGFSNSEQQPPLNLFPLMHAEVKRGKKELHVQVQNFSRNPVAIHSEPGGPPWPWNRRVLFCSCNCRSKSNRPNLETACCRQRKILNFQKNKNRKIPFVRASLIIWFEEAGSFRGQLRHSTPHYSRSTREIWISYGQTPAFHGILKLDTLFSFLPFLWQFLSLFFRGYQHLEEQFVPEFCSVVVGTTWRVRGTVSRQTSSTPLVGGHVMPGIA